MQLIERIKLCKKELGISYKKMSEKCGIPYSTFYSFTGGVRKLPDDYKEKLNQFLKNLGY